MIYLILSIFFTTALVLIFKMFELYKVNNFQAIVFNYITAGLISALVVGEPIDVKQIASEEWFPSTLLIGCLFISLFNIIAFIYGFIQRNKTWNIRIIAKKELPELMND